MEKIVYSRLTNFLEFNNLISDFQFGFRKGHSTIHPLTLFTNKVTEAINQKKLTIAFFCDLRKAFDTVDFEILLTKLFNIGVRGRELTWFKNYLYGRKLLTDVDTTLSSVLDILIGVPQGSILGPLLFLIYINDLPKCTDLFTLLFADDTTLVASGNDPQELFSYVNKEFKKVVDFFRTHKLSLHPQKTRFMIFSHNNAEHFPFNLFINYNNDEEFDPSKIFVLEQIKATSDTPAIKFLGIYFDPQLNFKFHLNFLTKKLSTALYFLRTAKHFLPQNALKAIYYTLFHSHLVYCNIIWTSGTASLLNKIFKLQKSAIRIISNASYNAHTEPIFKELRILPLLTFLRILFTGLYAAAVSKMYP